MICNRCGSETTTHIRSMFNTQDICMVCKEKERTHPEYNAACAAERAQVQAGNYNFEGLGLPADL